MKERIDYIQRSFDLGQNSAKLWSYTWIGVDAVGSLQAIPAIFSGHQRTSNIVGASESLLGLTAMIVYPFYARSSGDDLRKLPESTTEELKFKLDKAESWLKRNYKQEELGRSWLAHAGVLAVSMAGGGIIWHNDGFQSGLTNALACLVLGEVQIWTQPTRNIRDYDNYRRKYKSAYNGISETDYFIVPSPNGIIAGVRF